MEELDNEPHAGAFGNPVIKQCGAKSKRMGKPCRQPAMANGRCRLHGGKSTGPKTAEGLERSRKANWKHGLYSHDSRVKTRMIRELLKLSKEMLDEL